MFDLRSVTEKLILDSVIKADDGTNLYTPDGMGNYKAFWTRDFCYMVENAAELIPEGDIKRGIEFLMGYAAEDGWIPDRVEANGKTWYTAGGHDFPALRNLDNGPFICLCADSYLRTLDSESAKALFFAWNDPLCRALDCLPLNENGILYNDTTPPYSPYGFTDTIAKTGLLCFETLLVWRAMKALIYWSEKCGIPCEKYIAISKSIERCFEDIFLGDNGMLIAATNDCRQTDIWASCFALSIGFPLTKTTAGGIRKWLADNYDSVVCEGQIRHLPAGEYWERTFVPVEKETYQNGAFWATATGWFADAIAPHDMGLAQKTLNDAIEYFEKNGIFECINGEYRKLDTYVASACAVYGACKRFRLV